MASVDCKGGNHSQITFNWFPYQNHVGVDLENIDLKEMSKPYYSQKQKRWYSERIIMKREDFDIDYILAIRNDEEFWFVKPEKLQSKNMNFKRVISITLKKIKENAEFYTNDEFEMMKFAMSKMLNPKQCRLFYTFNKLKQSQQIHKYKKTYLCYNEENKQIFRGYCLIHCKFETFDSQHYLYNIIDIFNEKI